MIVDFRRSSGNQSFCSKGLKFDSIGTSFFCLQYQLSGKIKITIVIYPNFSNKETLG